MSKKLTTTGRLLTASREDRTLRYRLLPFGEPGNTNRGKITASAGSVEIPAEPLPTNIEHDATRPVGHMTVAEVPEGLEAEVKVANTRAGDDLLEEAEGGLRAGISVEIEDPVIRAGKLIAGRLSGAGHVVKPAYPSALLVAADVGEIEPEVTDLETAVAAVAQAVAEADPETDPDAALAALDEAEAAIAEARAKLTEDPAPPAQEENTDMTAGKPASTEALLASLAAALGAKGQEPAKGAKPPAGGKLEASALTLEKFTGTVRGLKDSITTNPRMTAAALDTITQKDVYDPTSVPAYLGELWDDAEYDERYAPLVSHEDLTGMTVTGWRWEEGKSPVVDDWDPAFSGEAPNESMNDIPTGEVVAVSTDFHAKRLAGGNRFDRVHIDFPVPGVLESFLREQTEEIKRRRDARVRAHLIAEAAKHVIAGTGTDVATVWNKIILGAMHVMERRTPTYAVLGNDLYREILGSDMLENLALLEVSLGLNEGSMAGFKIKPASITDTAMNGEVIVGSAKTTVLHEPAGAPIRVDAEELIKGAVDKAVFSYYLLRSDDRGGIVRVTGGA